MKILLTILLLLNFGVSNSQNFIDEIISCAEHHANEKLKFIVDKDILKTNFVFKESKTIVEIHNPEKGLERISLAEFKESEYPAIQFWLKYKITSQNLELTELSIPFNLNCTTPWSKKDTQEILEPYLKVLDNKTKIDLKKALEIGNENGLNEIYFWNIDYEKRKLIWTLKSKLKNNQSKVIKINSKNGKVISEFIEIPTD
ncbi:hypothetical protein GCM10011531_04130 [Aquaticitalea lipolytica]|uniref:PepSY domain-containing protein n=1 Tax=Aquaticitalea lipolytica TaxID=1247562 RepID=A0A8J2TLZ9_9FLAO|nr:hypothetical protein [Aquaticitalea lipolytica]GFZ77845.1 hypothetical protein GCM10011531_04130 [Aquaticitalea lipolytica]